MQLKDINPKWSPNKRKVLCTWTESFISLPVHKKCIFVKLKIYISKQCVINCYVHASSTLVYLLDLLLRALSLHFLVSGGWVLCVGDSKISLENWDG